MRTQRVIYSGLSQEIQPKIGIFDQGEFEMNTIVKSKEAKGWVYEQAFIPGESSHIII